MSVMGSLYISQQALLLNQYAINVTSNNIANMNTEGYSKQRVEIATVCSTNELSNSPIEMIKANSGAEIQSVSRYRDSFLDVYYRNENSKLNYQEGLGTEATLIENILDELGDGGLSVNLQKFYEAAQNLNLNPSDSVSRLDLAQQAEGLCLKFNQMSAQLQDLRTNLAGDINEPNSIFSSKIYLATEDINLKLEEITRLNQEISKVNTSTTAPNNLLDARDKLLDELSAYLPITVKENSKNSLDVLVNGVELVKGNELLGKLTAVNSLDPDSPAKIQVVSQEDPSIVIKDNLNPLIESGSLGAMLRLSENDPDGFNIQGVLNSLDLLAKTFADTLNGIQLYNDGTEASMAITVDANGDTVLVPATEEFFLNSEDGTMNNITAGNIQINKELLNNPSEIATARVAIDGAGNPVDDKAIGDNSNMEVLLDSRNTKIADIKGGTFESYLATTVGEIGLRLNTIQDNIDIQQSIFTEVQTQRESVMGVNLDEEVMDLVKFQRAYEASARVFNVCSEMLAILTSLGE